jgi:hypothetical protein
VGEIRDSFVMDSPAVARTDSAAWAATFGIGSNFVGLAASVAG